VSTARGFPITSLDPRRLVARLRGLRRNAREDLLAGPIRGELLGAEHLAERAQAVAGAQRLISRRRARRRTPLLARLTRTRRVLEEAYERLTAAVGLGGDVSSAGDWLLDNYHILQEHIGEVRDSLPRGYYRELPELAEGPLAGYPRVYELAITLISHSEGRVDFANVSRFVSAFQQVAVLTLGELWAVPAMLRLGLIENVRRMALRTLQRLDEQEKADRAAARIGRAGQAGQGELDRELDDFASRPPPMTPTFISRFLQQLRMEGGALPAVVRLEQWIAEEALSAEQATARTTERLALTQVMMANSITSLRAIAQMEWWSFVEEQSRMEAVLRTDPSGFYPRMTFATRDRYRHVVERIARRTRHTEEAVARIAIECAAAGQEEKRDHPRQTHVGYYLIDDGLGVLEARTGYRQALGEAIERRVRCFPSMVFVGGIATTTVAALAALFWLGGPVARQEWPLLLLPGLILSLDIAVSVVNQTVSAFLPPRTLPKLDLREHGIPPEFRTAVVIPNLFGSVEAVSEALSNLEVQFLANREAHLHFAVLSDFTDSATETRVDDAAILEAATDGVRALNARYAPVTQDAFYLFHRPRRWNPREGVWMGWERKRGKLAEFNRFVLGGAEGAFSVMVGDVRPIRSVRYVITLDADTSLPPDAAPLLVGALAHPLNRAVYDSGRGRVMLGYGILQPRVGVSLPSAHRSVFSAIQSGHPGVDPYTTAVSDVYQDLYGEGSFTGKGVYDVAAFERATAGRFPENTLLSHDLIEGSFARAGLATDVIVYDDYPSRYLNFCRRKHRWIRGDWQLLPWLTGTVPGPDGPEPNRLSLLSRWKLLDNLRRSTLEAAQFLFFVIGWSFLPGGSLRWTLLGLGAVGAPWLISLLLALGRPPLDRSWRAYYAAVGRDLVTSAQQLGLTLVFLAHQAWLSVDAIVRTLWRMGVTRRRLLEWQTASQVERGPIESAGMAWRVMWPGAALAGLVLLLVGWRSALAGLATGVPLWPEALAVLPLVLVWLASPEVAPALSRPAVRRDQRLAPEARRKALRYALLHWNFFDRFVNAETHWLAPDNVQAESQPVVAMRTSPTNIGLQLLATMSARDLGFLSQEELLRRLELAFHSLGGMRRFRGHFYNWYDLHDLSVLEPAYISTVDSGNLAGHLIALRQACLLAPDEPVLDTRLWRALETALGLAKERVRALPRMAEVLGALRAARVALDASRQAPESAVLLAEVVPPLERAGAALVAARLEQGSRAHAGEWIEWSLRLLAEHTAWATRIGARPEVTARERAHEGSAEAVRLIARFEAVAERAYVIAMEMDFRFLFDPARKLFAIGFQEATHSLDNSYYDLLASESRLASFIAVAKNDVPVEHWFHLGRSITYAAGAPALVSWSGSMFEYLMPALVMRTLPFTLLAQAVEGALARQRAYGTARDVPWGVSESAYNVRDRHDTYQYRAFGVPDLALKRGLGRELVVAPYASVLAAMVDPRAALENLEKLEGLGALGPYGFRDALDYTRPSPDHRFALVHAYMAHHLGMGLVALTNVLSGQLWQRRFHTDPVVRSAELLLHERIPRRLVLHQAQGARADEALPEVEQEQQAACQCDTPDTTHPHVALLGHLPYTIMVTNTGAGYSRYESLAVTRWRSDGCRDSTGQFCYLKDLATGRIWSAAHQPVCAPADRQHACLATDRVTFHRADGDIETRTEIVVVPEDSAEVRRVTVSNNGDETRELELTSYGELVLAPPDGDRAHPAFGNLFVETEWHAWCGAVTATRRPRSSLEQPLWCVHVAATGRELVGEVTCETDRARFLGRGRSTRDPVALEQDGPLSMTTGAVLDPIFALRARVTVPPGQSASVAFTTLMATSRDRAFQLADCYRDPQATERALDLAWTSNQAELRELGLTPTLAVVFQELAGQLFHGNPAMRAPAAELRRSNGSQPLLWANGVSGDWPILLATIDSIDGLPTLRQLLAAHRYWRLRGMTVDLVILNTHPSDYLQDLADRITGAVYALGDSGAVDRSGGVYLRRQDLLPLDQLRMLRATARVHIPCDGRTLDRILASAVPGEEPVADDDEPPRPTETRSPDRGDAGVVRVVRRLGALLLAPLVALASDPREEGSRHEAGAPAATPTNGFGELTADGDYEIQVVGDRVPPAPWANVIANPHGGFVVTERGGGFTWAGSSFSYRLTPWHNDPVSDPVSEVVYLQDDETGELWSATPGPVRTNRAFTVRHGAGNSTFTTEHGGIATELTLGMADDAAVKLSLLRVTNTGRHPRRLMLTTFVEWTLGILREHTQHQVRTEYDPGQQTLLARNSFDPQFASWTAFHALSEPVLRYTGSRCEFLGWNGTSASPAALMRGGLLHGTTGAGIDPCAALQTVLELAVGETREVAIVLGAVDSDAGARAMAAEYRDVRRARAALDRSVVAWKRRLSVIRVRTPEPSFDVMLNRWTLYQALACRMWARSALYQSSGAYGFRDQLQDVMAYVYAEPALARAHLLRAAARQFLEGDVQHWWHPQSGRGVRTRFSDDLAWLPYVVDHYVRVTGDRSVLDEPVPFLRMRTLEPGEHEIYDLPEVTEERASLYEHCLRALRRACTTGTHGLPLIGSGDWNDGMSRVGVEGRGESVWLAWFFATTLQSFAPYAESRGDGMIAIEFGQRAVAYVAAAEAHGWDGAWYRRAYFDDGTPLGSAQNVECRIDSIAQSWSVISGAGRPERQAQAMRSFEKYLVNEQHRLLLLLSPPFDKSAQDPGYIKGYLPGVRENGAQYTHAALWAVLATALRGDGNRAFELFQMLNPLTHARTAAEVATYKVEPYVVAADVYTAAGQRGRGGWTWYTGSASWMYRVGLEGILGLRKRGDQLFMEPRAPTAWTEYSIEYRHGRSLYNITMRNEQGLVWGATTVTVDGVVAPTGGIPLVDDGKSHAVEVRAVVGASIERT
jgi:cellobiose phosphorylase